MTSFMSVPSPLHYDQPLPSAIYHTKVRSVETPVGFDFGHPFVVHGSLDPTNINLFPTRVPQLRYRDDRIISRRFDQGSRSLSGLRLLTSTTTTFHDTRVVTMSTVLYLPRDPRRPHQ